MRIYDVESFDYSIFDKFPVLARPSRKKHNNNDNFNYLDCICAFDIETTRIREIEQSIMYVWQFQVDLECTVIGRTWEQFLYFLKSIKYRFPENIRLMTFVHNLSYEFSFLKGVYRFAEKEVFCMDSRKVAKCNMFDFFEFRCSYIQTNMSLKEFTHKMNVEHKKIDDFEYTEVRYPWSELDQEKELPYMQNDVLGLVEAIKAEMQRDNDTLYTIPLTSTGYIRRMVKNELYKKGLIRFNRDGERTDSIYKMLPTYEVYELLRLAFRGGNTHGNRYFATSAYNPLTLDNVHSADRSSSYPDVLVNGLYPMSPFYKSLNSTEKYLRDELIGRYHKPVVFSATLVDVRLKDNFFGCPYLAKAKCTGILDAVYDNGRILKCDQCSTVLTDVDLKILDVEYDFELYPDKVYYSKYGKLPKPIIDVIIELYKNKTELKGVDGQEVYYLKSKNLLNSVYGLMATNVLRLPCVFDIDADNPQHDQFYKEDIENDHKRMRSMYESELPKQFLNYAWGVWCTAHARYQLEVGIHLCGDGFVYGDTDSCKYIGDVDWSAYNAERIKDSQKSGAYATDSKGVTHYMGVFEQEEDYKQFRHMGAKKYAGVDQQGKLHITIAGVNKKLGALELQKMGGISAFNEGVIFVDAGGLEAVYNDFPEIEHYNPDGMPGHDLHITSNVVLRPSTYTLGETSEYQKLLNISTTELEFLLKRVYNNISS